MNSPKASRWATGLAVVLSAAACAADQSRFQGQVVSTSGGYLTISSGGESLRFLVADDAEISLDGQPATLSDLTTDHLATVAARRSGEQLTASQIDARSQKNAAAAVRLVLLSDGEPAAPLSDEAAIEGKWVVVSFIQAGVEADNLVDDVVVFADGQSIYRGKKEVKRAKYRLDPTADPKQFDLMVSDEEGKVGLCKGIYKFHGDALIVCHGRRGDPRPLEFSSDASNKRILVVLQRFSGEQP